MTRKHEVNIKRSKVINIQLWIIALLCFSYFMYEIRMYTEPQNNIAEKPVVKVDSGDPIDVVYSGVQAIPNQPEVKVIKPSSIQPTIPKVEIVIKPVVDNTVTTVEPTEVKPIKVTVNPVANSQTKIIKTTIATPNKGNNNTVTNFDSNKVFTSRKVDVLPVFPGCDKYSTNDERAACFQKKIQRHINRKFNDGLGAELGLKGIQRINLYFVINEKGEVSNIKARSGSKIIDLEEEAIRVAKLLPKMDPARSGKHKVKMSYNMPIVFDVR